MGEILGAIGRILLLIVIISILTGLFLTFAFPDYGFLVEMVHATVGLKQLPVIGTLVDIVIWVFWLEFLIFVAKRILALGGYITGSRADKIIE